jgi:hypothetical protein
MKDYYNYIGGFYMNKWLRQGIKTVMCLGATIAVASVVDKSRKDCNDNALMRLIIGAGVLGISSIINKKIDTYLESEFEKNDSEKIEETIEI